eukprot:scaffold450071_cov17-Prasinocladus_malaysianus.AAC.1
MCSVASASPPRCSVAGNLRVDGYLRPIPFSQACSFHSFTPSKNALTWCVIDRLEYWLRSLSDVTLYLGDYVMEICVGTLNFPGPRLSCARQ